MKKLHILKENLEDFELFILEMEDIIDLMQTSNDPDVLDSCKLRIVQIKQQLSLINHHVEQRSLYRQSKEI